jgi:hypothetical protein
MGRRLAAYNMDLIPYIPDGTHSFLDQLLTHIESQRSDSAMVQSRIDAVRHHLEADRCRMAAVHLWQLCNTRIHGRTRKLAGDVLSAFFARALAGDRGESLHSWCRSRDLDIDQIWDRWADFIDPTPKSMAGLTDGLSRIEAIQRSRFDLRRRKVDDLWARVPGRPKRHS